MKREEAFKLTSELLAAESEKIPDYIKMTVSLILDKIKERIQLGNYVLAMQYYDFTNHVRLDQHKEHVFKCALDLLVKEYNYKYVLNTNYKSDFHELSWGNNV